MDRWARLPRRGNIKRKLKIVSVLLLTISAHGISHAQDINARKEVTAVQLSNTNATVGVTNVLAYGADPTGTRDSSAAFNTAASSSSHVFAPCGTYLVNWVVNSKSSFTFEGAGECSVLAPTMSGTPVIKITGGNFSTYRNFAVVNKGNGTGSGIIVSAAANMKFRDLHVSGFAQNGLVCDGDSKSSGVDVVGGYYLNNGGAGIYYNECQDFHIEGLQVGNNAGYGILLSNSNAGQIRNNYIWQNGIAISGNAIKYDWISQNRVTQSQKQGFSCYSCNFLTVSENQSYQNSESSVGLYEDWKFSAVTNLIFTNNQIFDWTGNTHTNYGITLDSGSANAIIENNIFSHHTVASADISSKAANVQYKNNYPQTDASANSCVAASSTITGTSGPIRVGGSGSTVFLGGSVNSNEHIAAIPLTGRHSICSLSVFIDVAPGPKQIQTLTLRKNKMSTALTGTISGASGFAVTVQSPENAVSVSQADTIDIMMVSSTGAAPTAVRYAIALSSQ